jgi:hypothetical protein
VFRRVTVGGLLLCVAAALLPPSTVAGEQNQALLVSIAEAQIGKRFRMGAEGPNRFDCSGLVYFTYKRAGLFDRFGTKRIQARHYYRWGKQRGLLTTTNPHVGDLVLWTERGEIVHMGMFVGYNKNGKELAISALTTGVARHRIHSISVKFLTYVRTGVNAEPDPGSTPTPPPTPTPTASPTTSPTEDPTAAPTSSPTAAPSPDPTPTPTP